MGGGTPPAVGSGRVGRHPEHPAPSLPDAPVPRLLAPGPGLGPLLGAAWHVGAPLQPGRTGGPQARSLLAAPHPTPVFQGRERSEQGLWHHHVPMFRNAVLTRVRGRKAGAKQLLEPSETRKKRHRP